MIMAEYIGDKELRERNLELERISKELFKMVKGMCSRLNCATKCPLWDEEACSEAIRYGREYICPFHTIYETNKELFDE